MKIRNKGELMIKKGYYKHYKGGIYQVISTGLHTETLEEMVVYQDAKGQVWVRPASMWNEEVDGVPRFQLLEKRDGQTRLKFKLAQHSHRNENK